MCTLYIDEFTDYDNVRIGINDAFVVKYQAEYTQEEKITSETKATQNYLPLHFDQSSHSFIIALNDATEYSGGGTYFPSLQAIVRPGIFIAFSTFLA